MVVSAQQVAHADATTGKFALHLAQSNGFNLPDAFAGKALAAFLGGLVIAQGGGAGVGRGRRERHVGYRGEWFQYTLACFRKSVTNCCNFVRWWAVSRWRKRTFDADGHSACWSRYATDQGACIANAVIRQSHTIGELNAPSLGATTWPS